MGEMVKVCAVSELAPGTGRCVNVKGAEIAVFNVGGKVSAIDNTCPHQGGPLGEGDLDGTAVVCPWHGWRFDVTTGASPMIPSAKVKAFEVNVQGNDVFVNL